MARLLFLIALFAAAPGAGAADSAVVLMYHRFGEDRHPSTSVRLEQFEAQLEHLASAGYNVIRLEDLLDFLAGARTALPPRSVVITIDDAFRSVYEIAYPRLRARGFPFTVFVATGPVDQGFADYMGWEELREMTGHGASYGNHGVTHGSLIERLPGESDDAWTVRVEGEIDRARMRLEEELGPIPGAFAYPYGEYTTKVADRLMEKGYRSFGQQSGAVGAMSDPRALPRFPVSEAYGDLAQFRTRVASLPLPVTRVSPWEPVTTNRRPVIEVTLGGTDARLDELACFVGGQGPVDFEWLDRGRRFRVGPEQDLPPGRGRVNCTAPTPSGRYQWFSHPWFVE